MDEIKYRRFVSRFIFINVIIVLLVIMTSWEIMNVFKENYSDKEIMLEHDRILYGSITQDVPMIKLDIVKEKKPHVVALGSSRVMQFRADFFQDNDFYTMGGMGASIDEVAYTWVKIKENYIPDVVIIGIDPWWLNPNLKQVNRFLEEGKSIKYKKYVEIFRNNKLRKQLLHLDEIKDVDIYGGRKTIGLNAAVNGDGYRLSDGSYQSGRVLKANEDKEKRFKDTYERMERGDVNDRFVWCNTISNDEMNKLESLLMNIKESGAHIVIFLPPFPHEVYDYMDKSNHFHDYLHAYMDGTEKMCMRLDIPFYNFCDLAILGANDDEALDGFHGAESAYAKITGKMLNDTILGKYVDRNRLDSAIKSPLNNWQAIPASR